MCKCHDTRTGNVVTMRLNIRRNNRRYAFLDGSDFARYYGLQYGDKVDLSFANDKFYLTTKTINYLANF